MGPLNLIKMGILGSNVGFLDINPKYVSHLEFLGHMGRYFIETN